MGGVHALVTLARTCKAEGVQEQVLTFSSIRQIWFSGDPYFAMKNM